MSMLGSILVLILCIWYGGTIAAAYMQETKVGWKRIERKPKLIFFFCSMFVVATVHQIMAVIYRLIYGVDAGRKFAHYLMVSFYSWYGQFMWGPFHFEGLEHMPPGDEAVIYMANHHCSVDFCTIFAFPNKAHVIGVAKAEMMLLPGFGPMTAMAGGIFIKRGKRGTLAMLKEEGAKRLAKGMSIGIFPQGTRSVPQAGKPIKSFKFGAFALAVETETKIVPFSLLYPSDFMSAKPEKPGLTIRLHEPVMPTKDMDPEVLMKQLEEVITTPLIKDCYPEALKPLDKAAAPAAGSSTGSSAGSMLSNKAESKGDSKSEPKAGKATKQE